MKYNSPLHPILIYFIIIFSQNQINSQIFSKQMKENSESGEEIMVSTQDLNSFHYADVVYNLTAQAVLFRPVECHGAILQLFLSWEHPFDATLYPESYNIHVNTINDSNSYCSTSTYYKYINTSNITSWKMPEDEYVMQEHEIRIKANCAYSIRVESNPHNGLEFASINYTVPDCVSEVCSCRNATTLTRPRDLLFDQHSATLSWKVSSNHDEVNITKFIVKFGNKYPAPSDLYNLTVINEINFTGRGDYGINLQNFLETEISQLAEVFSVDSHGCCGIAKNITFLKAVTGNGETLQWYLGPSLPIASIVIAVVISGFLLCYKGKSWLNKRLQNKKRHQQWQGMYTAIRHDRNHFSSNSSSLHNSGLRPLIPGCTVRNALYIEKEIQDALDKGEADGYEVSFDRLHLGKEIGKGAFGRVFLAEAESITGVSGNITVAVKKLKNEANIDELDEFQSEISTMKKIGYHPNVVQLLGCCTLRHPFCMIMEYIPCGDLLQYLRKLREEFERRTGNAVPFTSKQNKMSPKYLDLQNTKIGSDSSYVQPESPDGEVSPARTEITLLHFNYSGKDVQKFNRVPQLDYVLDPKELQNFAVQIAKGMEHLEAKKITHRDLAARNILISNEKILKISDFGMSRCGIYVNTKRRKVPWRWLSVEAMRDNLYSNKSDVWAYAIVLWEIGTLGGFPYPTTADHDLLNFLLEGKRLDRPGNCTEDLYSLMLQCWSHSEDSRPNFFQLVQQLETISGKNKVYIDFDALKPNYIFPPTEQMTKTVCLRK